MGASPHVLSPPDGREPTAGPARFGRFELIERIGAGGMAEVFRAAVRGPEGFHRELVVKRILPELSARARFTQMFVNEAKISALLTHPNIVQIFEFGQSDGAYFIAMESVRGLTLREVLTKLRQQEKLMPVVAAAEITREVLIALDYAHNLRDTDGKWLQIVHRDISPSNVMVADTGAVKVLDFGIARAADLVADDEGKVVKGKIAYLAPEQITCVDIDARADVFAVGCVLHEILTGRVMFRAQNDLQKKIDLLAQASAAPSTWNSDVPPALDLVVARATARDPNARYTSAADMLADLENYLASFRSSSRTVLRLMRSLSPEEPRDEDWAQGRGQTGQIGKGGQTGQARQVGQNPGSSDAGPSTPVAAAAPLVPGATAATRAAKFQAPDLAPRSVAAPARADGTYTGASSSGGRGELRTGVSVNSARLGGAASAERGRFARDVRQRKFAVAATAALGLVALWGVVAGGRALWGRVSRPSLGGSTARASAETFVLVTFNSTPPGAQIIDGAGKTVGTTPFTLPVTSSQIVVSLRLRLEGYAEATASAVPDADKTVFVELKPVRRAEKSSRRSRAAKTPSHGR